MRQRCRGVEGAEGVDGIEGIQGALYQQYITTYHYLHSRECGYTLTIHLRSYSSTVSLLPETALTPKPVP